MASSATPPSTSSRCPLSNHFSYDSLSLNYKKFSLAISSIYEPKTFQEAVVHDCWRQTIEAKLSALENNATWSLSSLPHGKKTIGCKWIFKVKFKPNGSETKVIYLKI